ncbi:hypothetical protein [Halopseudomonas pelagia]|uniref:hypothetical protein n=1 Tax=Halopseudomonas pelagia TaxID=553151 RepID=UPI0030D7F3F3|tara:strand:- start:4 stop:606 length:603 start_codon:yes stop_codon:yes gene_type:complete
MIIANWQAVLTFALVVFLLLPLGRLSIGYRLATLLALILIALIPLSTGLTLAGLLRGLTDDLALTSLIWMAGAALVKLGYMPRMPVAQKWPLWLCFAVLGLVLYPAALGIGMIDTYRWGYNARYLIVFIGVLTLLLVWLRSSLGVAMLVLATAGFVLGLKASDNYWDYLLDPFIVLYSFGAIIIALVKAVVCASRGVKAG